MRAGHDNFYYHGTFHPAPICRNPYKTTIHYQNGRVNLRRNCWFRIYSISWFSLTRSTTYKNYFLWPHVCKKSFLYRKFSSTNVGILIAELIVWKCKNVWFIEWQFNQPFCLQPEFATDRPREKNYNSGNIQGLKSERLQTIFPI